MDGGDVGQVWSLYDDIKREILRLYGVLFDSMNNYRMLIYSGRSKQARDHYLTAGKALRKMIGLCVMSGGWPRSPKGLGELRKINASWFNNGREPLQIINDMDFIEAKLEEYFTATHFFDIRVDSGRRGVLDVTEALRKCGL